MALAILKQVMEEEIKPTNIELCVVPMDTKKFTVIGDEVSEHNRVLSGMQDNMNKTDSLLGTTLGKLTEMGKNGGSKHMCYMVLFFFFMIFLLYWNAFRKS